MIYCLSLFPHEGFNNVKVMYFCNNVDDNLAVDKIRMFRPNKLSIVPCEATRTQAWVRRSLDTNTGGFLLSPFPQNVRGFMERIWEQ